MRIRKRFPASSNSSAALSDPHPNRLLAVQPQIQANSTENLCVVQEEAKNNHPRNSDPQNQPLKQASSQQMMIGSKNPICDFCTNSIEEKMKQKEIEDERWKEEEEKSSNDTRKESTEVESTAKFPQPTSHSSSPVDERWCEGDKAVPLKKRKGSFERIISGKETTKPKMKSKTNKKCLHQHGDHGQEEMRDTTSGGAKKSKRGSVIMEGSRCSRVNGRGWRCCQQTLVGYSLCEHHLGKGRLRSMTSVRNRAIKTNYQIGATDQKDEIAPLSNSLEEQEMKLLSYENVGDDDADDEKKKPLMVVTKKRMKLGAVKARSMSSLLDQTNNAVLATDSNKISG